MSTHVPDYLDAAELWAAMRGKPAPEGDAAVEAMEDDLINQLGIDLTQLAGIADMLLPFCAQAKLVISYIPSATPGKVWNLSVIKPQGRPAYAAATEGVLEGGAFTFEIHLGRGNHPATRVAIQRPVTAKRRAAALEQLKTGLSAAGLTASTTPANSPQ